MPDVGDRVELAYEVVDIALGAVERLGALGEELLTLLQGVEERLSGLFGCFQLRDKCCGVSEGKRWSPMRWDCTDCAAVASVRA